MTPEALVDAAAEMLGRSESWLTAMGPRAASLLARQSIEESLRRLWLARAPGVEDCSSHAQLLCLPAYLRDVGLAESTAYAWVALSRVCHHHAYELTPNVAEVREWIETARRFADETR